MSRKRLIRHRNKRRRKSILDLDITSLLDILVILLVFLLKNYNSSNVVMNIPKDIRLPNSTSRSLSSQGVVVQVSNDKIWVDDKNILSSENSESRIYDRGGRRIISLYNELVAKKKAFKLLEKTTDGAQKFTGYINLIVDKEVKYSYLRKLMYTCAVAGFREYKFVVLGEE